MKIELKRKLILNAIFILFLSLNLALLFFSNPYTINNDKYTLTSLNNKNPDAKITQSNSTLVGLPKGDNKVNSFGIQKVLQYPLSFNASHTINTINLNTTQSGDVMYFQINQDQIDYNLGITVLDDQNRNQTIDFYQKKPEFSTFMMAKIIFTKSSGSEFIVNSSNSIENKTFSTILKLFLPSIGYNYLNPIAVFDNETNLVYESMFPYETIFTKLTLENNRRVDFSIDEVKSGILDNSQVTYFNIDPITNSPSPIPDEAARNNSGSFQYSWVAQNDKNELFIEIKLASGILGNFSLSFNYQKNGFSFSSAIPLNFNASNTFSQQYQDRYVQSTFFSFNINETDIEISLLVTTDKPLVVANSIFSIYYERDTNKIFDISAVNLISNNEGVVNTSFFPTKGPGIYYIEYKPALLAPKGSFSIILNSFKLPTFVWRFEFIIFNIFYFIVIPALYFYLKFKENTEKIDEWEVNQNFTEVFKTISRNSRLNPKMEVPFQKILLIRKNLFVRDIILDIIPVQFENDDLEMNIAKQTSVALRYKKPLDVKLSAIISIWIMIYWILNLVFYQILSVTVLPYRVADLNSINSIIYFLTIPLVFILLIVYFFNESYIKYLSNEIEYSIKESSQNPTLRTTRSTGLDNENILKNLAYVRVLWNQAVKAFNEKNYSLFIIRADNAIKKLIETRFTQLLGSIDEKLEFGEIIELVRNQGFDVPSAKKIEYFRKIRNKVVHSSHLLDEKTAIETFTYYSKFLGRLGMRT